MPLASKKNQKTDKVAPAQSDQETEPRAEQDEVPAQPKVTALIYSYNDAEGLRRSLAALEASTARAAMEILVVDKGSQDESPRLDPEFPETTFLRLPRNFGTTKALNIGMRTGVGEYVFFLSPAMEVGPETVAQLLARLEADSDAVAACPLVVDEHGKVVEQVYRLPTPSSGARLVPVLLSEGGEARTVEYATFQAMMVRKYFIRGINYLDDRFGEFGADAELCYQIQRAGRKVKVYPEVKLVRHPTPEERSAEAETLLEADRINGLAVYFGKHFGFMSGLMLRIGNIFKALASLRFGLFASLLGGTKVDGSQSVTL
jgi:GT2 family glycosyltransferase